jgi:hypothetical protein
MQFSVERYHVNVGGVIAKANVAIKFNTQLFHFNKVHVARWIASHAIKQRHGRIA